jgi:hypothetical protein
VKYDDDGVEIGARINPATQRPYWTAPDAYKIHRQPVHTSDEPFQMPEGTAIDLRASGIGSKDYFYWPDIHDNPHEIQILFSPEGSVSRVSFSVDGAPPRTDLPRYDRPIVDNIYLLVGNRENVPQLPATDDPSLNSAAVSGATTPEQKDRLREKSNWLRGNSRWVVIGSQTGRIATVANSFVDLLPLSTLSDPEMKRTEHIVAARALSRETTQETAR